MIQKTAIVAGMFVFIFFSGAVSRASDEKADIELSAECTWHAGIECKASCEDLSFYAGCEGEWSADCSMKDCSGVEFEASCKGSCEADCSASCEVDPGSFDCSAECEGSCSAECTGSCESSCSADCEADSSSASCKADCKASCEGSCTASCSGKCSASCQGTPPSADCDGKCEASCEGSCQAKAEVNCDIDCRSEAWIDCEAGLSAKCTAGCDADGYLECNGSFIDKEDLEAAIAWVDAHFDLTYEGGASGECSGNQCEAEAHGSAEVSCSQAAPASSDDRWSIFRLLSFLI